MGWFSVNEFGDSFAESPLMWGDGPADIMDAAIEKIVAEFRECGWGTPNQREIRAGLEFALGGRLDVAE